MLLVRGGQILAPSGSALEQADVFIDGDRIVAVGPALEGPADAPRLDARGQIVLPGLINAHTHAHNNLTKGLGDNWTLEDLLNHGPALQVGRTPEEQYLSAVLGAVEMLETGCTAAFDMFSALPAPTVEGVEAVVQAYTDVGLRGVLAPMVGDLVFYRVLPGLLDLLPPDLRRRAESLEAAPAAGLLQLAEDAVRRWDGAASGRIRMGVAPTIPGHCSDALLVGCARLAREHGVSLQTHLAESKVQAVAGLRRWGKTITQALAAAGMLGPRFVGGHAVWLTPEDIHLLADAGAAVAHNPASNLKLGSGIAPVREMLDAGVVVGLGTDGSMSSDNQNLFEAMRVAGLVNKVRFGHEQDRWIGARAVWGMATEGSARCLGLADDVGAVAPGRQADLVLLRGDSVFLRPLNDAVNALVYAETGADVTTVLVAGRVLVEQGRIVTVDAARLRARAQDAVDRLRAQNAAAWALAEQLGPYVATACRAAVTTPYPVNRYATPIAASA
ncbi:MAG: amidohydrolase family protein [Candidatus Rokuibacteriota bacterium]